MSTQCSSEIKDTKENTKDSLGKEQGMRTETCYYATLYANTVISSQVLHGYNYHPRKRIEKQRCHSAD